jgi:uncharacterized protein
MLIRFNVGNFLSFNKNQEFSMSPGRAKSFDDHIIKLDDMKLLKFGAVYGANASGKSNFIKAIDTAKQIITRGMKRLIISEKYYRLNAENSEIPTTFEFEIRVKDKCYAYGFKIILAKKIVHSEWLSEITSKKESVIFERIVDEKLIDCKFSNITKDDANKLNVYIDDLKEMPSTLLLPELARKKFSEDSPLHIFQDIFMWFAKKLVVVYPDTQLGGIRGGFSKRKNMRIAKILEIFDTGITHFRLKEISENELYESQIPKSLLDDIFEDFNTDKSSSILFNGPNNIFEISRDKNNKTVIQKLVFEHGKKHQDIEFEYHEESDGTQRLIELMMIIQESIVSNEKVFVIDEIDRSLHPQLTKKFIELFFRLTNNTKNQLIATTHESELMDLSLLRRDEIWFIERDENYQSRIFSLDQFKERYDKKVSKAYLEGRYGAVPVIKSFDHCGSK